MKILFSGYPSPFAGGGQISALTLLGKLADRHEVATYGIAPESPDKSQLPDQIRLYGHELPHFLEQRLLPHYLRRLLMEVMFSKGLSKLVEDTEPDLIITQEPPVKIPGTSEAKILLFIRAYDYWFGSFYPSWWRSIYNEPFNRLRKHRNLMILRQPDLVIANSKFTARELYAHSIEAEVVYPFVDLSSYEIPSPGRGDSILFVNPTYHKGLDIVLRIAQQLPAQRFLMVGDSSRSVKERVESYDNIQLQGFCDDMRDVYRKTRIALVPSVWEEPFGRIPVEAGINGIPTIASARGGLPESVGEGGILVGDIWNIEKWIKAIRRLDDPETYREFSAKAKENAKKFKFDRVFSRLRRVIDSSLDLPEKL